MTRSDIQPGGHSSQVRIVIADDHGLVRQGFQRMLAREEGFTVVGEAEDGREAVELCSRLRPDLVLMDVRMPTMDGLVATREIKQGHPETSVLMVTMQENPDYLLEAVKAGAAGYVLKGSPNSEIMSAIHRVGRGRVPPEPRARHVRDPAPRRRDHARDETAVSLATAQTARPAPSLVDETGARSVAAAGPGADQSGDRAGPRR